MPWKASGPVTERMKFVVEWSTSEDENFAALSRKYGISRKTGYKWLDRFERGDPPDFTDRPRNALVLPHRTAVEVVDRLVVLRKEHPTWGPKKLRAWLMEREPGSDWPAASTIGEWLKRYGLLRPRKRRLRVPLYPGPLEEGRAPNELWCADFKGHFGLGDRSRCYPLTITDHASRYLLKCEGLGKTDEEAVKRQFELAFREFGLPARLRTDNGPPFASVSMGGLTGLSVWWVKLGIVPERIEPGHPEQNGRHERMHRTLKEDVCGAPMEDLRAQQRVFDLYRAEYNLERPHEALLQKPPGRLYTLSLRDYPSRLEVPEYGDGFETRWVSTSRSVSVRGHLLKLPSCLAGEPVGLKQVGEERWEMYYGPVWLCGLELRGKELKVERTRPGENQADETASEVAELAEQRAAAG
jgi:putative transposase